MNPNVVIRNETKADVGAIGEVTVAAFKTLAISNHTEQFIIVALRAADALAVSLVAESDGRVVGHPDYYRKFGFKNVSGLAIEGVPPEFLFVLSFDGRSPQGNVVFHEGFAVDGPQGNKRHLAASPAG